jgi:hypothetical protein
MIENYDTLTDLWHQSAQKMLFATRDELDFVASIDTMVYNNVLSCDSMKFDFDLGRDLWLTPARFTVLQTGLPGSTAARSLSSSDARRLGWERRNVV